MKKIFLAVLAALPVVSPAQNASFTVNGKLPGGSAVSKAYLSYVKENKNILDSAEVKAGVFQFKGTTAVPARAIVILDHAGAGLAKMGRNFDGLFFYLGEGTTSVITLKDSIKYGTVTGTAISKEYDKYKKLVAAPDLVIANVNGEYNAAPDEKKKDEAYRASLNDRLQKAVKEKQVLQEKYIKANPGSYLSIEALGEMAGDDEADMAKIDVIYKGLSAANRATPAGVELGKKIGREQAKAMGALAPDFTQNDVEGKPVKLSDFRGKYVLIDFWASWCGPCRKENPNVVRAFNTFKDKNFTVLGVSLDRDKASWLKAIKDDGLTWTQVSDLKFWQNEVAALYDVRGIPQNFLVDPTGKIVGKNLRGEALEEKLKEVLK